MEVKLERADVLAANQRTGAHAALSFRRIPGVGWLVCPGDGGMSRKRQIEKQERHGGGSRSLPPFGEENQAPHRGTKGAEASGELVAGPGLELDGLLRLLQGSLRATK